MSEQGNLGSKMRVLLKKLSKFDEIMKGRVLSEWEISSKNSTLLEYEELLKNEEISWRQKSRSLWLKEGKRKTKFFHKMVNAHKRYNNIDQLVIEGELFQDPSRVEGEIVKYYRSCTLKQTVGDLLSGATVVPQLMRRKKCIYKEI